MRAGNYRAIFVTATLLNEGSCLRVDNPTILQIARNMPPTSITPVARISPDGRLDLSAVTLVAVSSVALRATARALCRSMEEVRFGQVRFLTDIDPAPYLPVGRERVDWIAAPLLSSRMAYSRFILKDLHRYVETDFALVVQWDGYVLNRHGWNEEFLQFDYIGAPWPQFADGMNVGNGGFSLRSARLLRATTDPRIDVAGAEDVLIGRRYRRLLEQDYGIRIAGPELAQTFSYERLPAGPVQFGFHGVFNMVDVLGTKDFLDLHREVESVLIGDREQCDLVVIALRRCLPKLLWSLLKKLSDHKGLWSASWLLARSIVRLTCASQKQ